MKFSRFWLLGVGISQAIIRRSVGSVLGPCVTIRLLLSLQPLLRQLGLPPRAKT